jgi:two-component system, cell cycle response regulator
MEMALVLIVQAHDRSRADMAATLRAEGHDVLEAATADAGVQAARDHGPEIILLDPMLPDRSGYELYAALQRDAATLTIPVLFLPSPALAKASHGKTPLGGPDIVTRLGLALRTKSLHDELRLGDVSLKTAVLTDSLTGLANRRAVEERLRVAVDLAKAGAGPLSIVLADLDGFAAVNDEWGYAIGDHALQAFAGLLHESCRGDDTIGRYEGEAFLVILPGTKLDAAWHVAERVRERTASLGASSLPATAPASQAQRQVPPPAPKLSASFGVTEYRPDETWRGLLDRAVAALQRAKRAGRNRCEVA